MAQPAAAKTDVYCYCNGPNTGTPMIQCDKCEKWFHGACIGLSPGLTVKDVDLFLCGCSLKNDKALRYKTRRSSKVVKGSADAGANDAAASATGGQASTSKEKPMDDGSNKKSMEKKGRIVRSKKEFEDFMLDGKNGYLSDASIEL